MSEKIERHPLLQREKLRMDAYYYGFDSTGNRVVDEILSAVAWAGKAYHSTAEWTEPFRGDDETTCAELIEGAAKNAAAEVRKLEDRAAKMEEALRKMIRVDDDRDGEWLDFDLRENVEVALEVKED